jgi:CRISPR/Cas system-associated protein endoribonuclease Cas2
MIRTSTQKTEKDIHLHDNKYVCILSIAVMTQVDYASMITILGSYIVQNSGHNTYQGHVNDSEMFREGQGF